MDTQAFEKFLEQYERDIFTFCKYLTMDTDLASELYQETALAAFQMIDKINPDNNPKSFMLAIAAGKWKNMRRKSIRRQAIAPEVSIDKLTNTQGNISIEKELITAEMAQCINNILANMKDKFKLPLILHYFDEMSMDEIGKILAIPPGTVKSRLFKGRALLKKSLEKEGFYHE